MGLFNNRISAMAEACVAECQLQIDSDTDGIAAEIAKLYNIIEPLEEGVFKYGAEMIPVIHRETSAGAKYIVEMDMLIKLAKHTGTSVLEAFRLVCETNDIEEDDTYVVVDDAEKDAETVTDTAEAIKASKDTEEKDAGKEKLAKACTTLKEMVDAGVHLLKL